MSRKTKAISEELLSRCKEELKKEGIRGENGRRLQAIISAKKYSISQVSRSYNISRSTLMRWIAKFKEGGKQSFQDSPRKRNAP